MRPNKVPESVQIVIDTRLLIMIEIMGVHLIKRISIHLGIEPLLFNFYLKGIFRIGGSSFKIGRAHV